MSDPDRIQKLHHFSDALRTDNKLSSFNDFYILRLTYHVHIFLHRQLSSAEYRHIILLSFCSQTANTFIERQSAVPSVLICLHVTATCRKLHFAPPLMLSSPAPKRSFLWSDDISQFPDITLLSPLTKNHILLHPQ